jgi:predicted nucleic acid-binding protein
VKVLVDSDVLIEVSRGRNQVVSAQWRQLIQGEDVVFYSPVTAAELWAGALPREHGLLSQLFDVLQCANSDKETGRLAGDLLRQHSRSHNLELGDALIAATAIQNDAALWTRNRKHYPMKALTFYEP